mmetsp:Transcript_141/g.264  ORF Transcript_141/g.264 Transcript_141/m.264 type:complete len:164 (+) Transcript_141:904-1395(+)
MNYDFCCDLLRPHQRVTDTVSRIIQTQNYSNLIANGNRSLTCANQSFFTAKASSPSFTKNARVSRHESIVTCRPFIPPSRINCEADSTGSIFAVISASATANRVGRSVYGLFSTFARAFDKNSRSDNACRSEAASERITFPAGDSFVTFGNIRNEKSTIREKS